MRVCRKVKGSHDASLQGLEEVLPCPCHTFQPCPRHKVGPSTACSLSHLSRWRAPGVPNDLCVLPHLASLCSWQACILLHNCLSVQVQGLGGPQRGQLEDWSWVSPTGARLLLDPPKGRLLSFSVYVCFNLINHS